MNDRILRVISQELHKSAAEKQSTGDADQQETQDWIDSLEAVVARLGRERARFLLDRVLEHARRSDAAPLAPLNTDYVNTIPATEQPPYPGDLRIERRIRQIIRWNAALMVHRANKQFDGIGGHISTYASSATLYEVGFNHFFRGKGVSSGQPSGSGDQIYFQGHAAPGIYARAFLEGRLSEDALKSYRRETSRRGLSSYPHPRLMPEFWEFPTVSMGLGPVSAIYQARFNRYLQHRSIRDTSASRVWCFVGDGECDEPETLGLLGLAAREELDNLVFVINCNLQRLDGPVRGNGKVIQELEGIFRGAGWHVIKVVWGPEWDELLNRDGTGKLRSRLAEVVDGQFQRYTTTDGEYIRRDLFGADPQLLALVEHLSGEQIRRMRRGGHCPEKVFAAYARAQGLKGRPTVVLAHTVKGWSLGESFEGSNATHQKKKFDVAELKTFRDALDIPITDEALQELPFYHPGEDSPEVTYLKERRSSLGGPVPQRRSTANVTIQLPPAALFDEFYQGMSKGQASTTMVFSRLLAKLLRDKSVGKKVVPIIPDEARTFGMDALFSQVGIYSSKGQLYEPVDKGKLIYYREARDGQVLEEGISEAGALASFTAAATSYAIHGEAMIPFYIFYSMFGFQRVGDQIWAATDSMARGFLLGATAGRTTLHGEGLQHDDGHSHVLASCYPGVRAYDVAFGYELAAIIQHGLRQMFELEERKLYYITLHNEDYAMPPLPEGALEGCVRGLYRYRAASSPREHHVQLFGSGPMLNQALRAQEILEERFGVSSDVWSVTSYSELRNDAIECERWNQLNPTSEQRTPYISRVLRDVSGPFIAATDYMKSLPDMVARWVPGRLFPLGTDGFGMSDTREALRRHFEVDAESIAATALSALHQAGQLQGSFVAAAIQQLGLDSNKASPLSI